MKTCTICSISEEHTPFRKGSRKCRKCESGHALKNYYADPEKVRRRYYQKTYGISLEQLDQMLQDSPVCPICGKDFSAIRPVVDHDHVTGKIRGLLCDACNIALGLFGDNQETLKAARRYLRLFRE